VHNLKGNHKIHHFRTGVAPGAVETLAANSETAAISRLYPSRANTNPLTGGTISSGGPTFAVTGD